MSLSNNAVESDWDSVLFYEENAYDAGKKAGIEAAEVVQTEGVDVGLARGYTIGLELGFIESSVKWMLNQHIKGESLCSMRMKTRLELIAKKCADLPNDNNIEIDHVVLFDEIKALFKSSGLPVFNKTGAFSSGGTEEW